MENSINTVESILSMQTPTNKFLVSLNENIYGIRFKGFKLRDCDTGEVFHEFAANDIYELDYFADHLLQYRFTQKILKSKTLGSTITLVVGDQFVQKLILIERHYIEDTLVASYRSDYPAFMPNSENNAEFIYSVPNFSESTKKKISQGEVIEAISDTFIFVNNKLIIHRRASYEYYP
jgi:hypothetical protein